MIERYADTGRRPSARKIAFTTLSGGVNRETDGNLLPQRYAEESWNFRLDSGALADGEGARAFELPAPAGGTRPVSLPAGIRAVRCYFYKRWDFSEKRRDDRVIALGSDGALYAAPLVGENGEMEKIPGTRYAVPPVGINYRYGGEDVFLLSSEREKLALWSGEGEPSVVADSPFITSMAVHSERLFATSGDNPTVLWFSDDFDPAGWYVSLEEAGFIDFPDARGALLAAVEFLDYVYVFRAYGITRITAYGDQTAFSASQLYVSSGRIFGGSVTLCGDRIVFLAEDGLYEFDGIYTRRVAEGVAPMIAPENDGAVGRYHRGRLYLALDLISKGERVRAVFVYRPQDGAFYLMRGVNVAGMETLAADDWSELAFVLADGRLALRSDLPELFGAPLEKTWRTPLTDFGLPGREKLLAELSLFSDGEIAVEIESDREKRTVRVAGGRGLSRVRAGVRGSAFRLTFRSQKPGARVSRPVAEIDLL